MLFCVQVIQGSIPMLLKWAVDTAKAGLDAGSLFDSVAGTWTGSTQGDLALYAGIMVVLALVQWAMNFGMRWYITCVSRFVERDIRLAYVQHLVRLPLSFFQTQRVGDLMARASNDVEAIQRFLYHAFRMSLQAFLSFWISLILMCSIDWELAIYALIPMPIMMVLVRWVGIRVRVGYRRVQEQFAELSVKIHENLAGMRVVKAYAREPLEIDGFTRLNDKYVALNRHLVNIRSIFYPFTSLLNGASMLVILWLGGLRVIDGTLTLGAFVAFNAYLIRMSRPMMMLGRIVDEYQRAIASMDRIKAVLAEAPQVLEGAGEGETIRGEIEFCNVSFSYNGRAVLKNIDLKIPAGSTVALVGRVGSGKSTLARLIPRLIHADAGEVRVDGKPVSDIPLQTIRGAIGYVPQDTFLFSDTIRENVALGLDGHVDGSVERATEISQLAPDLDMLPGRLDTMVGERGVTLSGGQKQRTSLARAVIREPRILILDDALSSVDTHTEEEILKGLRDVMASRTTILIAHRVSTVKDADHIVVLDEGRIVEQGTHDDLVEVDGIYADMYRRQHLVEELDEM
ncbi:MAG: ABC transporter ATP-binding protein [bacterium]|nr:ABC transporter ATP-binding protein [bacterium]